MLDPNGRDSFIPLCRTRLADHFGHARCTYWFDRGSIAHPAPGCYDPNLGERPADRRSLGDGYKGLRLRRIFWAIRAGRFRLPFRHPGAYASARCSLNHCSLFCRIDY
jgi:hypothetical protein